MCVDNHVGPWLQSVAWVILLVFPDLHGNKKFKVVTAVVSAPRRAPPTSPAPTTFVWCRHSLTKLWRASNIFRPESQDCLPDTASQPSGLTTQALQVCFHGNQVVVLRRGATGGERGRDTEANPEHCSLSSSSSSLSLSPSVVGSCSLDTMSEQGGHECFSHFDRL